MTKQLFLLFSTLILAASSVMGQTGDSQSWKRYTVDDRDFSVSLPVQPVLTTSRIIVEGQDRSEQRLKASADPVVYSVDVYENPKGKQTLETFVGQHALRKGWEPTGERSITVNDVAGKEFVFQNNQIVVQFFSTKRRLYRFSTMGAPADDARVQQFFSSIALGEKVDGLKVDPEPVVVYYREELDDMYTGKDVDQKARIINKPAPLEMLPGSDGSRGRVVLMAVLSASGRVVNIRVVQPAADELTRTCIEAARRIKFTPAIKNGKPVSMWMTLEYNLNL